MKKVFNCLVFIPNSPLILILSCWTVYKIYKHTNFIELHFDGVDPATPEIKKFLLTIYPKHLRVFLAVMFYLYIVIHYLL